MEIRSIKIDFDKDILEVNGKKVEKPVTVTLLVANLPFWQWRSPAEMILMAGLFWQVAFVAVVGTGYQKRR